MIPVELRENENIAILPHLGTATHESRGAVSRAYEANFKPSPLGRSDELCFLPDGGLGVRAPGHEFALNWLD